MIFNKIIKQKQTYNLCFCKLTLSNVKRKISCLVHVKFFIEEFEISDNWIWQPKTTISNCVHTTTMDEALQCSSI